MTDQTTQTTHAVPTWFWVAAAAALLFEAFGVFQYLTDVTTDHATLPLDQRAMWAATPTWIIAFYAIAVWTGLAGAILLLLRRRFAVPALLVSLVAALIQFSGLFLVPQLRQTVPENALIAPVAISVCCYLAFMLARRANQRGWLR